MRTRVGYTGGTKENPTYQSMGDHTEAIQIDFDPRILSYPDLLRIFWSSHNPCARAWSVQYKSAVFFHDAEQERLARATSQAEAESRGRKITTAIVAAGRFYRAEDYHQKWELRRRREFADAYGQLFPDPDAFTNSTAVARVNGYLSGYGTLEQLRAELPKLGLPEKAAASLQAQVERRSPNR